MVEGTGKGKGSPEKLLNAVKSLEKDKTVKLGNRGYVVKRARGKGAKGFVVEKIVK